MGTYSKALEKAAREGRILRNGRDFAQPPPASAAASGTAPASRRFRVPSMPAGLRRELEMLRERIEYSLANKQTRVIALCGVNGREGCTTITAHLSLLYANRESPPANGTPGLSPATGVRFQVLLVDGNVHTPGLHSIFAAERGHGLADIIVDQLDTNQGVQWIVPNVHALIAAGRPVPAASEVFKSSRLEALLKKARRSFRTIIFDCAAINVHPDVLSLASLIDGVVLVVREGHSTIDEVQRAKTLLEKHQANILGVALCRR